jgi:hypothetical protein
MNFLEARQKLKELAKGEYRRIQYDITEGGMMQLEVKCEVYVHGYGIHSAPTWDEALHDMACELYPYGVAYIEPEIEDVPEEVVEDVEK